MVSSASGPCGSSFPTAWLCWKRGFTPDAVTQLLAAPWAAEMVTDVIETPKFCEPGDPPEMVLRYARDVVAEYVRKRFELTPES